MPENNYILFCVLRACRAFDVRCNFWFWISVLVFGRAVVTVLVLYFLYVIASSSIFFYIFKRALQVIRF